MADKKNDTGFTVTDRRLFTAEGELRKEVAESSPEAGETTPGRSAVATDLKGNGNPQLDDMPSAPSPAEQKAHEDAYRKSSRDLDRQVELSGRSAKDLEMTFERFLASLYMTAMLQLGLMQEEGGQPRIDLIGARQTIDTLGLISDKTKGNLTAAEANFLQNCLYELRMAYIEVTNSLTRPPESGETKKPSSR